MRVNTELIQQYAKVMMESDNMMANGMSRFGFFASSPVHRKYSNVVIVV